MALPYVTENRARQIAEEVDSGTIVQANVPITGTEPNLYSLAIDGNKYISSMYITYPDEFNVSGTFQQFVQSVLAYPYARAGSAFLGELPTTMTGLPFVGNMECIVTVLDNRGSSNAVVLFQVSSSNVYPYHWEYNSHSGDYKWKAFISVPLASDLPSADGVYAFTVTKTNGAIASSGWTLVE